MIPGSAEIKRRRLDHAVAHDEEILATALGHVAVNVEQERLVVAVAARLVAGEDRIDVMARGLGERHQGVVMEPHERRGLEPHAFFGSVLAEIRAPRPSRDRDAHLVAARREPHLALAVKRDRAQVTFLEPVDPHHVAAGLEQLFGAERNLHLDNVGGVEQAPDMLGTAENRRAAVVGFVAAHPFEHGQAVVEAVAEDVDVGLVVGNQRAVDPDFVRA